MEGWEKCWTNSPPLSVNLHAFLHVNIQAGVEGGVIAKSLLQKTEKTPNLNAEVKS